MLVGAQAAYLHTGETDLFDAAAPYTADADLAIGPADPADSPLLGDLLSRHDFTLREHPGSWVSPIGVHVDRMVPEAPAGPGSYGARLGAHGNRVARRAKGLEAALIDLEEAKIRSLDPSDGRRVMMQVAGSGALVVAKIHKIIERSRDDGRISDKDTMDVLRRLQATDTNHLAERFDQLRSDELSAP